MQADKLLKMIPDTLLNELSIETGVNKYSKKLQGQFLFKLLLYCILSYKDNSLRKMESAYESLGFGLLNANLPSKQVRYNSISDRLKTINPIFFKRIYDFCISTYKPLFYKQNNENKILRFDSTIVTLSSKLLYVGYNVKGTAQNLKQIKYTVGYDGLPIVGDLYTEQIYTSENAALKTTILNHICDKSNPIRVFDRGISARKTFDELSSRKIPFVSRIHTKCKKEYKTKNSLSETVETSSLFIESDSIVYLFNEKAKKSAYPLRYITAITKGDKKEIHFITNIFDLETNEITEIYKQRWEIECFFRFIKQELNFSHLINRSKNGIEVMLYATLIAAILLLTYKSTNNLKGYKITKQKFIQELEKSVAIDLVGMCGGDVDIAAKLLNLNST